MKKRRAMPGLLEAAGYGIAFLVLRMLLVTSLASRFVPPAMRSGLPSMDPECRRVTREMVLYLASDCRL